VILSVVDTSLRLSALRRLFAAIDPNYAFLEMHIVLVYVCVSPKGFT